MYSYRSSEGFVSATLVGLQMIVTSEPLVVTASVFILVAIPYDGLSCIVTPSFEHISSIYSNWSLFFIHLPVWFIHTIRWVRLYVTTLSCVWSIKWIRVHSIIMMYVIWYPIVLSFCVICSLNSTLNHSREN